MKPIDGLTLFDSCSLHGHWEIANATWTDPDTKPHRAGELSFDGEKGKLRLLGSLDDLLVGAQPPLLVNDAVPGALDHGFWLHGVSVDGDSITLGSISDQGGHSNSRSPLAVEHFFEPRYVVIGACVMSDSTYRSASLSFPGLTEFFHTVDNLKFETLEDSVVATVCTTPSEIDFSSIFSGEKIRVNLWQKRYVTGNFPLSKINTATRITIESSSPQKLDWWIEVVYSFQYLMSILYGFPTCPDHVRLTTVKNEDCSIWYSFNRSAFNSRPQEDKMVITALICRPSSFATSDQAVARGASSSRNHSAQILCQFLFPAQEGSHRSRFVCTNT